MKKYDVIVIGAGSGGLGVGIGMAQFGFDVLMVEKDPNNFGGECLNAGCIPSKALIHVTRKLQNAREASQYGLKTDGEVDFKAVMDYVHNSQDVIRAHESAEYLREKEGIDIEIGEARFIGKNAIAVGANEFTAKKILVATGSKPRMMEVEGMDQVQVLTNESLFEFKEKPKDLLVVGGGPIGMEMSQAFARMGTKVSVLEVGDRIMSKELPEVSELLQKQLEKEGIQFHLNSQLKSFENGNTAVLEKDGKETRIAVDAVLMGIGRTLNYEPLHLPAAGIEMKDGKPLINDYLQAKGNKNVVFAGDAANNMMFSHAAEMHTTILLTNFFTPRPFKKKLNFDHFSWCTFTDPEVCTFGLSQDEIEERGISYDRIDHQFDLDDRAVVSDYRYGRLILFLKKNKVNPRNGKILGGTVIAPHAGEMAQELIMANHKGLGAGAIFNKTYPYPVQTRVHKMALVDEFSKGISPAIKKMMKLLFH